MRNAAWAAVAILGTAGGLAFGTVFGVAGSRPGGIFFEPTGLGQDAPSSGRPPSSDKRAVMAIRAASAAAGGQEVQTLDSSPSLVPSPVRYDGTSRSLNLILKEADFPTWARWRLLHLDQECRVLDKDIGRSLDDRTFFQTLADKMCSEISEALEEDERWAAHVISKGNFWSVLVGLTQEEQSAALLVIRDEELALESLRDGALTSQEQTQRKCEIKEETKRRLIQLLGEERYYSSLLSEWSYARAGRAAELAGVDKEVILAWVRLQEDFEDRRDRLYGISLSDEVRQKMMAQLTEEREQRESVLFGARHAAFKRFQDPTYWHLKKELSFARTDANVDTVYDVLKSWIERYRKEKKNDARNQIASEGRATLRKAFPEIPDTVWHDCLPQAAD